MIKVINITPAPEPSGWAEMIDEKGKAHATAGHVKGAKAWYVSLKNVPENWFLNIRYGEPTQGVICVFGLDELEAYASAMRWVLAKENKK